jgi:hypothetical protein
MEQILHEIFSDPEINFLRNKHCGRLRVLVILNLENYENYLFFINLAFTETIITNYLNKITNYKYYILFILLGTL